MEDRKVKRKKEKKTRGKTTRRTSYEGNDKITRYPD